VTEPTIVYSPEYDIHLFGLERLHPFDGRKYSKAWRAVEQQVGERLRQRTVRPDRPITTAELLTVHTQAYLDKLKTAAYVAQVLELPILRRVPMFLVERRLLRPMRLAVRGTVLAAQAALKEGLAVNLAGGYHHASQEQGEGFCCFADVNLAITLLRQSGELVAGRDRVLIIDLDAHQGNGHERLSIGDSDIYIFDMYNGSIYPQDRLARQRIDYDVPLPAGVDETVYLQQLHKHLPLALQATQQPKLAFYIAGTDIYERDQLGGLGVSGEGIEARDKFVLSSLSEAGIPVVMLAGGGYSADSYQHIANSLAYIFVGQDSKSGNSRPSVPLHTV
jgi:histone deacetylase 11